MTTQQTSQSLNLTQQGRSVEVRLMSPAELAEVQTLYIRDGGYQRDIRPDKVAEIQNYIDEPWCVFAPLLLARSNGRLYEVDGQHRRQAFIAKDEPCLAMIVDYTEQEARQNFVLHNSKRSVIPTATLIKASNNPLSNQIKELALQHGASVNQVRALVVGIVHGHAARGLDVVDIHNRLEDDQMTLAVTCLGAWTQDPKWEARSHNANAHAFNLFSASGTLQAIGALSRKVQRSQLAPTLTRLRNRGIWHNTSKLARIYGTTSRNVREMVDYMLDATGGITIT